MNENHREELYKLFQKLGRGAAVRIMAEKYGYSQKFVDAELSDMIDDTYDLELYF